MTQNPATAKKRNQNLSLYDPSRENVGKIYRDAQINSDHVPIIIGDLTNEFTKDLITDINEALCAPSSSDEPFYLRVIEKRDLQMPNRIDRLFARLNYRPWPEDNTMVFWKNPKTQELRFCWCIPHHTEMFNIENNPDQFDPELVADVKAWKEFDMVHFGFYYDKELKWIPNPRHKDKPIEKYSR